MSIFVHNTAISEITINIIFNIYSKYLPNPNTQTTDPSSLSIVVLLVGDSLRAKID